MYLWGKQGLSLPEAINYPYQESDNIWVPSPPWMVFWLTSFYTGLEHTVTATVSSCVKWSCHVQQILLCCRLPLALSLKIFCSLFFDDSWISRSCDGDIPFRTKHIALFYFLYVYWLWLFVLIMIYSRTWGNQIDDNLGSSAFITLEGSSYDIGGRKSLTLSPSCESCKL